MIEGKQDRELDFAKPKVLIYSFALLLGVFHQIKLNLSICLFLWWLGLRVSERPQFAFADVFSLAEKHGRQLSGWWKTSFQSSQIWLEEVVFSSQNSSPDGVFGDFDWFLIRGEVRTHVIGHSWWRFQAFWLVLDIYEASSTAWESISVYKLLSIIHSTYCFGLRWKTRKVSTAQ